MNVVRILGLPLLAVVDNVQAVITARSVANARDAAVDTAIRSLAHRTLNRETTEASVLRYTTSA